MMGMKVVHSEVHIANPSPGGDRLHSLKERDKKGKEDEPRSFQGKPSSSLP